MFKYIPKVQVKNNDNRTTEQKLKELKECGISISVRDKNAKYKQGYILGRISTM